MGTDASSLQMSVCLVNLGNITRPPKLGGKQLAGNCNVLAELWAANWGHVIGTLEADVLKSGIMQEFATQYRLTGILRQGQFAPAIAAHVRAGEGAKVELLDVLETHKLVTVKRQTSVTREPRWTFHGCIFKITFGKQDESFARDPVSCAFISPTGRSIIKCRSSGRSNCGDDSTSRHSNKTHRSLRASERG